METRKLSQEEMKVVREELRKGGAMREPPRMTPGWWIFPFAFFGLLMPCLSIVFAAKVF